MSREPETSQAPGDQASGDLLADREEPVVAAPHILVPAETEPADATAVPEIGHVAATIPAHPRRTEGGNRELALKLGILRAKSEKHRKIAESETSFSDFLYCLIG